MAATPFLTPEQGAQLTAIREMALAASDIHERQRYTDLHRTTKEQMMQLNALEMARAARGTQPALGPAPGLEAPGPAASQGSQEPAKVVYEEDQEPVYHGDGNWSSGPQAGATPWGRPIPPESNPL